MAKRRILMAAMVMMAPGALAQTGGTPGGAHGAGAGAGPGAAGVGQAEPLTVGQLMQDNGGSLFRASLVVQPDPQRAKLASVSYFSVAPPEPKQLKKHDLITIVIREESEITSDGKTDLKKNADFNAHLDEFVKLSPSNWALMGGAQGPVPPSVKFGADRDFKGEGKYDRSDSFTTRIAAEVVDVKPNGTVAIQARKSIKHDEEQQDYVLTGICRGTDVTPDNSIYSWQIYDLAITVTTDGTVTDTQKRGLVPKLLDAVNPF